ncbi:MAG: hypothetical protein A2139_11685 [Desulfobacca sp. RBG_16_60_12]|nr:MAG: hypothetical protein A2139_11685 [Desulfobacca sp. RBG_16_60_12]
MGFFDIFKPKWKHTNVDIRREAIIQLEDQSILSEIAETDPDEEIRNEAIKRINDPSVLAKILNKDRSTIEKRVAILSDEEEVIFKRHNNDLSQVESAARKHFEKNEYEEVFKCYSLLTKFFPKISIFWRNSGIALYTIDELVWKQIGPEFFKQGKKTQLPYKKAEESIAYFDKALEFAEYDHLSLYYKGLAFCQIGQLTNKDDGTVNPELKKGLSCFKKALEIRPNDSSYKKAYDHFYEVTYDLPPPPF